MELADTSAWTNRHRDPAVEAEFARRIEQREIATCHIVVLELLWSARDGLEFTERRRRLEALPEAPINEAVWVRALDVYEALAARGPLQHRGVKIPDVLIAAAAEVADLPICHYDAHFDRIAEITGQPMRAIAPLGSL